MLNARQLCTLLATLLTSLLLISAGRDMWAQGGQDLAPPGKTHQSGSPLTALPAASATIMLAEEVEPNNTITQATPLAGDTVLVRGSIYPSYPDYEAVDVDYYAFSAGAGDRVYAAVMTAGSSSGSTDSTLMVISSDGVTLLEEDLDDGVFGSQSSSIAGTELPLAGTYYLRISHRDKGGQLRPYHLHFRLQSGNLTPEVESNDSDASAQLLPNNGWISGALSSAADEDWYKLDLSAGDTLFASLDLDPTRDNTQWDGRLALGLFAGVMEDINDDSVGTPSNPLSEAHFMTVKSAGTYYVRVAAAAAAYGDYHLTVAVHPAATQDCVTYLQDQPLGMNDAGGPPTLSYLFVPGNPMIGDLNIIINLQHEIMSQLDVALYSPAGAAVALFTDIGSTTAGSPSTMNLILDDEAALPIDVLDTIDGVAYQPEHISLAWLEGIGAGHGEWTLLIWDDTPGHSGVLLSWGLEICAPAEPPPACPAGSQLTTVYSTNFEADQGGFTHGGTGDEWEWGLPEAVPIMSCRSGTHCWKTDLDGTYDAHSNQDLLSPIVDLSGYVGEAWVIWAQKYQMENASFDHAFVEVRTADGMNPRRLWQWQGGTMQAEMDTEPLALATGWRMHTVPISDYLGQSIELRYHVDSNGTEQYAGLAVDDVSVLACTPVGKIEVTPSVISATVSLGSQATQLLDIHNLGSAALDWSMTETSLLLGEPINVILDGSFEEGTPNPYWSEFSQSGVSPFCTLSSCGNWGSGPRSGEWWVLLGTWVSNNISYISQTVTIPPGTATLSYWLEIPSASSSGSLSVKIDGNVIAGYTEADVVTYPLYAQVTHDISAYADGGEHVLEFYTSGGYGLLFYIDDVALWVTPTGPCDTPADIPWLTTTPAAGTAPAGGTSVVEVSLNTTELAAAEYGATLCIHSNDPAEPVLEVPVLLTVEEVYRTFIPSVYK